MEKYKKIISAVTAVIIGVLSLSTEFSPIISNFSTSYAEEAGVTEDGFHYKINDWGIVYIELYEGTNPDVVVPTEINGYVVQNYPDRLFADNQTIKTIDLSECRVIGNSLFENSSVESVILPKNIQYIPNNTFKNCKNLKNVEFGNNVLVIPESAFEGSSYVLPADMAEKVRDADYKNTDEGYIYGDEWNYNIKYGTDGNFICLEKYTGNNTDIVIPDMIDNLPVRILESDVFGGVVTSIIFPLEINRLTNFLRFKYPEKLKSVTFRGNHIRTDTLGCLKNCNIEEIVLPHIFNTQYTNVFTNKIFKDSQTIKKVEFVNGKDELTVEELAFGNCSALDTVAFKEGYDYVTFENNVFKNSSLRRFEIYMDCTLTARTFSNCKNLQEIVLNGNINAPLNTFSKCPINNIILDNTSVSVSRGAFDKCTLLKNINSEPAFDESTGDFNAKYKDFIIKNFSSADDVGFVNEYVIWQVKDIVNRYTDDSMSDMEKVKILHDWVCENISYSTKELVGAEEHNDLSPFLTGVTVCDGYARALNLLLHEAGIETYQVSSNNHIWNIVKIGGHYFHVDTTWDDSEEVSNDWFLKSDAEISTETSSHSQWKLMMPSSLHNFQGDTMPECLYAMGDCNTDGNISVSDIVKMNMYLLGTQSVSADDIVLYDLDFNGDIDVFDMIEMRKLVVEKPAEDSCLEDINLMNEWLIGKSDYIKPELDMNGDGKIDVFDMIILRQNLA